MSKKYKIEELGYEICKFGKKVDNEIKYSRIEFQKKEVQTGGVIDYIITINLSPMSDPEIESNFSPMSADEIEAINEYINDNHLNEVE